MARFIIPTMEAVVAGDISSADACYTLAAHLATIELPAGKPVPHDEDVQAYVTAVVLAAAEGRLPVLQAARRLIGFKEMLASGVPLHDILESEPENYGENR
ncbi:hypothetical protein [Asticcacaulis sp.]|uniref:hypothetical protein n=1 Tax=Asticcacaulis sp. TaxID=1872648 RepID=UPI002C7C4536|nr:hypothetical protein [Asticcacaulis sp.]HTM82255.1 hypothetical protein [Asticcacaulis sp.]